MEIMTENCNDYSRPVDVTTACIILSRGGPETLICQISSMEVEATHTIQQNFQCLVV